MNTLKYTAWWVTTKWTLPGTVTALIPELPAQRSSHYFPSVPTTLFYHTLVLLFCSFKLYIWVLLFLSFFVHYYIYEVYLLVLLLMGFKFFPVFGYHEYYCHEYCNTCFWYPWIHTFVGVYLQEDLSLSFSSFISP